MALLLLAGALYVYDAMVLLASNEAVLARRGRGWTAVFGAFRWRLLGKEPCAPGLLAPHRRFYRLAWSFTGQASAAPRRPVIAAAHLRWLALCCWLSAITLFVLLPLCFFYPLGTAATLLVIAQLYAANLAALAVLWGVHRRLNVPAAKYWATAFECLVCPPFCINLVRRACEWEGVDEDFLRAAAQLSPASEMAAVHAECLLRVEEQMAFEDEHSPRMQALLQMRATLQPTESET